MDGPGSAPSPHDDRGESRRVVREAGRQWARGDAADFHLTVDRLARDAAGGSETAGEALLTLVHQYGLARPGVASVFAPGADFGAYSASKAAAHQIGKVAALELAELGVRVNLINADAVFSE
ncbi:MAG: SDR family NAD(P)-dependent oxidoreductase, partial [Acidimicrobiales bacterium]